MLTILLVTFGVLFVLSAINRVASWGHNRIGQQAENWQKQQSGCVLLIGIAVAFIWFNAKGESSRQTQVDASAFTELPAFPLIDRPALELPAEASPGMPERPARRVELPEPDTEAPPATPESTPSVRRAERMPEPSPFVRRAERITPPAVPGTMLGLGIVFTSARETDYPMIESVVAGAPATRAGLRPGASVRQINGSALLGAEAARCVLLVQRGPDAVELEVLNPGSARWETFTIRKERIALPPK